jgi:NADH-quinone oxidoreductase subunit N
MVVLFVFGMLAMVLPFTKLMSGRNGTGGVATMTGIGFVTALGMAVLQFRGLEVSREAFSGMVAVDGYALFIHIVILLAGLGSLVVGHDYLRRVGVAVPEYYSLLSFTALGMMLLASSGDLIMLFVALEVMSVGLYVLCGINRGEWRAVEGAFKYLILGAFSSAIMVYGIAYIYGATGTTRLTVIAEWFAAGHTLHDSPILAVGLGMLVVGFAFKVAAFPFHMWSPDVYQGAPTSVTLWMASGVKAAAFAAFGRVLFVGFLHAKEEWVAVLWTLSALSMVGGNVAALVQTDLKRMLAFSSVGHAGYLLMALVAAPEGGLAENPRMGGLLFYLLAYTVMNIGAFAAVSMLTKDGADDTRIERLAGLGARKPVLALALTVCLFSLAGIPPTMGFVGKFYLFASVIEGGHTGLAIVGALSGALGVYYYLRPMVLMYMRPSPADAPVESTSPSSTWALCGAAAVLLLLGLMPGMVVDWARSSVLSIFAG